MSSLPRIGVVRNFFLDRAEPVMREAVDPTSRQPDEVAAELLGLWNPER